MAITHAVVSTASYPGSYILKGALSIYGCVTSNMLQHSILPFQSTSKRNLYRSGCSTYHELDHLGELMLFVAEINKTQKVE